jgi:trans-L-3-hydroxyproline dehydratase
MSVVHPEIPEFNDVYGVMVYGDPRHDGSTQANCCVYADRAIDRSPTGSGTAGRIAQLYLRGELSASGTLVNESIIGTVFKGRVLSDTKVGDFDAVIPEVSGRAYICGFANWTIDEEDPLTFGFLVQ